MPVFVKIPDVKSCLLDAGQADRLRLCGIGRYAVVGFDNLNDSIGVGLKCAHFFAAMLASDYYFIIARPRLLHTSFPLLFPNYGIV